MSSLMPYSSHTMSLFSANSITVSASGNLDALPLRSVTVYLAPVSRMQLMLSPSTLLPSSPLGP